MWLEYRASLTPEQIERFMPWRDTHGQRSAEHLRKLVASLPLPAVPGGKLGDLLLTRTGQWSSFSPISFRGTRRGFSVAAIGSQACERLTDYGGVLFGHAMQSLGAAIPILPASGSCGLHRVPQQSWRVARLMLNSHGQVRRYAHSAPLGQVDWLAEPGQKVLASALSRSVLQQLLWLHANGDDVQGRLAHDALAAWQRRGGGPHLVGGAVEQAVLDEVSAAINWRVRSIGRITLVPVRDRWKMRFDDVELTATAQFDGLWTLGAMKVESCGRIVASRSGTRIDPAIVAQALQRAGMSSAHALMA